MDELVQHLSQGNHPVTVGGPQPTLEEFQTRVQNIGYAFIKFVNTRGGTDLGVRIDKDATNLEQADFALRTGVAHIEGTLTLNYVQVRCIADIDLATLNGTGHLLVQEEARSVD